MFHRLNCFLFGHRWHLWGSGGQSSSDLSSCDRCGVFRFRDFKP